MERDSPSSMSTQSRRKRGRPFHEVSPNEADNTRRARMREAQRIYRQRKKTKVSLLQSRVLKLERALGATANEFVGFSDRFIQSSYGGNSALEDMRFTINRVLEATRSIDDDQDVLSDCEFDDTSPTQSRSRSSSPTPPPTPPPHLDALSGFPASWAVGAPVGQPYVKSPIRLSINTPGYCSPRLDYGILRDLKETPSTAASWDYRVGHETSFATCLWRESIKLCLESLLGNVHIPGFLTSALRYGLRHVPTSFYIELGCMLLQLRPILYSETETYLEIGGPAEEFIENASLDKARTGYVSMMYAALADFVLDGQDITKWLDPWSTYDYIRNHFGLRLTATSLLIPKEVIYAMRSGKSGFAEEIPQYDLVISSQTLIQRLSCRMMCIGGGPRYHKNDIDEAVRTMLRSL